MKQLDLLTKEEFEPKRITQKFVNAKNRIKYHNDKANALRHSVACFNKPLLDNLRILNSLLDKKGAITLHKQYLKGKGFSFDVHTHFEEYKGKTRVAVYDFIIMSNENDQINIVRI